MTSQDWEKWGLQYTLSRIKIHLWNPFMTRVNICSAGDKGDLTSSSSSDPLLTNSHKGSRDWRIQNTLWRRHFGTVLWLLLDFFWFLILSFSILYHVAALRVDQGDYARENARENTRAYTRWDKESPRAGFLSFVFSAPVLSQNY